MLTVQSAEEPVLLDTKVGLLLLVCLGEQLREHLRVGLAVHVGLVPCLVHDEAVRLEQLLERQEVDVVGATERAIDVQQKSERLP